MLNTSLRIYIAFALFVTLFFGTAQAQQIFERKTVEVSNMGISYTNVGAIGTPGRQNNPGLAPSMEFPAGSGTEHLFEAGLWIGAVRAGVTTVSTAAVTNPSGYTRAGQSGYEFTNDGMPIMQRSSLPDSDFFSPEAVSHQDFIAEFSDRRDVVSGRPIADHEDPLYADVRMETYNWNFGFTDGISIIKYEITNNSHIHRDAGGFTWEDVYFGMYSDMVVRNINTTEESGGAFFNKGGVGYIDSLYTLYTFDSGSTDFPRTDTYGATVVLGAEYRDVNFHPKYADEMMAAGYSEDEIPIVGPRFWKFGQTGGTFNQPRLDSERYAVLSEDWDYTDFEQQLREDGQAADGNYIQLHRFGPVPEIEPGETITVYFAYVAALKPEEYQGLIPENHTADELDNPDSRRLLKETADWAFRLFEGSEDPETGQRERFLVPEPPEVPLLRVELDAGKATLYWDRRAEETVDPVSGEKDFDGYRIYRSKPGADLTGEIAFGPELVREYDTPGTAVGYGTGFDEILLPEPVIFDDDDTEYWYSFTFDGLLSGWQYQFSVTAFDRGDAGRESLESSRIANAIRVFPGTAVNENFENDAPEHKVSVYPNPYRINAAWDGGTEFTRKINFRNLPALAEIRIYTLAGDIVATLHHEAENYDGDIRWYRELSGGNRVFSGGEHSWDLLTKANQNLSTGLYLFSVRDRTSGHVQTGKFAIIK